MIEQTTERGYAYAYARISLFYGQWCLTALFHTVAQSGEH